MSFGLPDTTVQKMNDVFRRFPEIEEVILYGSRAKGTFKEGSDIDITLIGSKLNNTNLSEIITWLEELNTPYFMDVSIFHAISSNELLDHIKRVGKIFYKKTEQNSYST
ncbi:MAG: nucleotidyltransferase domain-containing protein [Flavobacterium sp.]